jgi:hypothetical protein
MCWRSVSTTETLLFSGAFVSSAVHHGTRQMAYSLGLVGPEARTEREARIYRENAGFMESLGLDPDVVLEPAPESLVAPARTIKERRRSPAPLRAIKGAAIRLAAAAGPATF